MNYKLLKAYMLICVYWNEDPSIIGLKRFKENLKKY